MIPLPTPSEVVALYHALEAHLDIRPQPIRDSLLLELACARPHLANPEDVFAASALLAESLLNNRPFHHLNEATTLATLLAALRLNGVHLACSSAQIIRAFAEWRTPRATAATISKWLQLASEPIRV